MAWVEATPELAVIGAKVRTATGGWYRLPTGDDEEERVAVLGTGSEGTITELIGGNVYAEFPNGDHIAVYCYNLVEDLWSIEIWREE